MKRCISAVLAMLLLSASCGAEPKNVQAVVRGNTAVVAVPHAWLYERCAKEYPEMPPGERITSFQSHMEIVDEHWLMENLPDGVADGMCMDNAYEGKAYYLDLDMQVYTSAEHAQTDRLRMNERYIGDTWYLVFRQKEMRIDDSCRYVVRQVYWDDEIELVHHWGDLIPQEEIDAQGFRGDAAYETRCGDLKISIFEAVGANIAVIEEENADKNRISQVRLRTTEGWETEISGYMQGSSAVYCCVLSDQEVEGLKNGKSMHILRDHLTADYADSPWGITRSGEYWGIVDKSGHFIVDAKYIDIERTEIEGIFVLQAPNLSFAVYDANRRRGILTMAHDGGWGTGIKVMADGTILAQQDGKIRIYGIEDGRLRREIDADADPDRYMEYLNLYLSDSSWVS